MVEKGDKRPRLKIVVRKLPATISQEKFYEQIEPYWNASTTDWCTFVAGKKGSTRGDPDVHSRAYAKFKDVSLLTRFVNVFQGHTFIDDHERKSQATIEYAPYQKVPHQARNDKDHREGTLESDPEYLQFLENLKAPPAPEKNADSSEPAPDVTKTPLLEYLRHRKLERQAKKAKKKKEAAKAKDTTSKQNAQKEPPSSHKEQEKAPSKVRETKGKRKEGTANKDGTKGGPSQPKDNSHNETKAKRKPKKKDKKEMSADKPSKGPGQEQPKPTKILKNSSVSQGPPIPQGAQSADSKVPTSKGTEDSNPKAKGPTEPPRGPKSSVQKGRQQSGNQDGPVRRKRNRPPKPGLKSQPNQKEAPKVS